MGGKPASRLIGVLALLLMAWILSPILFVSQLEAYSANLSSLALNFGPDAPTRVFPEMELQGEYLYQTRIGVILLLTAIGKLTGVFGTGAFHGLMIAGFVLFCGASIAIVRRFVPGPFWIAPVAFFLIPGAVDTAFFANDNMISAGLALAGVALVAWTPALWAYVVAGLALGFAIMCRVDAVFVAPMLVGMCWLTTARPRDLIPRAVASIGGTLAALGAIFLVSGVSLFDALAVGRRFTLPVDLPTMVYLPLALMAVPGLVLAVLGAATFSTVQRKTAFRGLFILYPLLTVAFFASRTSLQIRHFYPLIVPFLATHIAAGIRCLTDPSTRSGTSRGLSYTLVAALSATLVLPPNRALGPVWPLLVYKLHDGPRNPMTGRIWMPLLWFRWQTAQATSSTRAAELVASLRDVPRSTILVAHYDDIAYLTLALFEDGYRTEPAEPLGPTCSQAAVVVFTRNGSRVIVIRADNQYFMMPTTSSQTAAFFARQAMGCNAVWQSDRFYLTMMGRPDRGPNPHVPISGIYAALSDRLPNPASLMADLSPDWDNLLSTPFVIREATATTNPQHAVPIFHAIELTRAELATIRDAASAAAPTDFTYADFRAAYRSSRAPPPTGPAP
jgi:hypothetical protein